jgi:hypothetical protein
MLPPLRLTVRLNATESHRNPRASAARSAAGRTARKIIGSVSAVIRGIPLIREASAQPAYTNGRRPSDYRAADGRRTRSGIGMTALTSEADRLG